MWSNISGATLLDFSYGSIYQTRAESADNENALAYGVDYRQKVFIVQTPAEQISCDNFY